MAYCKEKDGSNTFTKSDYERLKRDKNLLKLEVDRLNRKNTKLSIEVAQNKLKNVTLERLIGVIDEEYSHNNAEFIKYLHDVAHHFDNPEENYDEYDDILPENCDKDDEL